MRYGEGNTYEEVRALLNKDRKKLLEILEEKTSINSETKCWEWQGTIKDGYGRVIIDNELYYVHRLSAMLFLGYFSSESLHVLHAQICPAKNCWNFNHLYIGTQQQNMQDRLEQGTAGFSLTHCKNGHEFTPENTYLYTQKRGGPGRGCKICRVERTREWRAKKKVGTDYQ